MKQDNSPPKPPRWASWLLERFCAPHLLEEMRGDLEELYQQRAALYGKRQANYRYIQDVLSLIRPFVLKRKSALYPPPNSFAMFTSYLTIAFRNLIRQKGSAIINISGLAMGMAVAILISLLVYDELSFNKNHENYDSIVKVYRKQQRPGETFTSTYNPAGLGTLLRTAYKDHFKQVVMVWGGIEDQVIAFGENTFTQGGYFMQPEGPEMLTLQMVYGSQQGLKDVKSILLSETLAKKLFGEKNPVNEIVRMDAKWDLLVTGVYRDLPKNSEFKEATYFAPLDLLVENDMASLTVWDNQNMYIYAQLKPGADYKRVSALVKDAILAHVDEEKKKSNPEVFLMPMSQWHLYSKFENGQPVTSDELKFVRLYGMIGLFVLLLACINFMNLSTARSATRAKEVGIRKTIGSVRSQLVGQFLSESILLAAMAFVLSLLLVQLSLPWFNEVADKEMVILWSNPLFWIAATGFTLFTGLVAGSYPALYLSSFNPAKVLKGTLVGTRRGVFLRKSLVTFQFTVSITLTIGTLIVYQQIQYAKNRPVGYSREGLISLHPTSPEYKGKYEVLRDELKKTGVVNEVAQADYPLTNTRGNNDGFDWKGKDLGMEDPSFNTITVTHDYGKTVGLEFISGRDFSRGYATDKNGVLINESAAKLMGLENPVGEIVRSPEWMGRKNYQILGVVKDMVKESPFTSTRPSIIFLSEEDEQWLFIRLKPTVSASAALPKIEKVFKSIIPSAPFDYKFADEEYKAKFQAEERVGKLAAVFASLAIFISCLGLFGLASYTAEQRTKEIGIRKVLGASVSNIWSLLSKDFVGLVILSSVISAPIAWYFLNGWLENYEYRTTISPWIFAIASAFALLITVATVSYQAIKAALANPVKSLRNE